MPLPASSAPENPRSPGPQICAVVITYNAPEGLKERLTIARQHCDALVVVDNASTPTLSAEQLPDQDQVYLITHAENQGIARALNLGVSKAQALGAQYALLLDHDSIPMDAMTATLLQTIEQHTDVAVCVPAINYALPDIRCRWPYTKRRNGWRFEFVYADQLEAPHAVDLAIGSGMLVRIDNFLQLGGFTESLFIDLVDTEFCLRLRAHGLRVMAVPQARLQHRIGEVRKHKLLGFIPVFPTHHSPIRHYYISRNRVILTYLYARRFPSWLAYEWLGAVKLLTKTILFEPPRIARLWATIKGSVDGIRMTLEMAKDNR